MLDDGAIQIKKTATTLSVKKQVDNSAAMEKVPAPQRFLNSLFDGKMVNPVKLLEAKQADRTDIMLNSIPLPYDRDSFFRECRIKAVEYSAVPDGLHPLVEIDHYKEMVFKRRTGTNTEARKASDSADKLLRTVPMTTPEKADTGELTSALDAIRAKRSTLHKSAEQTLESEQLKAENKANNKISFANKTYDDQISELIEKRNTEVSAEQDTLADIVESLRNAYHTEIEKDKDLAVEQQRLESELKQIASADSERVRIEEIKKVAAGMESDAEEAKRKSHELTSVLKSIEAYKARLCDNLPISGLSVVDGEILIDGVPWEQVNTARQIDVAVQVSALRAKDQQLKIIWVDDAEHLDSESLEMLKVAIEKHGMQPFLARVSDSELTIKTEK